MHPIARDCTRLLATGEKSTLSVFAWVFFSPLTRRGALAGHEPGHEPVHEPPPNARCHFLLQTAPGSTVFGISKSIAAGFPGRMTH